MQSGDEGALGILFERYRTPAYWAGFSVLKVGPEAEDVVVDTFAKFWEKRASIEIHGEALLPWFAMTARYLALNLLRKRDHLREHEVRPKPPGPGPDPEAEALAKEALRAIDDAKGRLSATDQEIFELCIVENLTYKEAAQRLGTTHATVRNRLSRIRLSLGTELAQLWSGQ